MLLLHKNLPCNWRCFDCLESCPVCYHQLKTVELVVETLLDSHDFFHSEPKNKHEKEKTLCLEYQSQKRKGKDICSNILFVHAILWCDVTWCLYEIGEGTSLRKFKSNQYNSCTGKGVPFSFHTWCNRCSYIMEW